MPALSKGPYVCVVFRSLTQMSEPSKVEVSAWQSWLLDMKALDGLSPPWVRYGPKAGVSGWSEVVRQFGEHCQAIGAKAATEGHVRMRADFNYDQGVGLMVLAARFDESVSKEQIAKEEEAISEAVFGEFYKLANKSRSKTHPVMRVWDGAPEGADSYWPLDLLNLESDRKSERWAEEFCAAIEASQIEAAAPAPSSVCGPKSL